MMMVKFTNNVILVQINLDMDGLQVIAINTMSAKMIFNRWFMQIIIVIADGNHTTIQAWIISLLSWFSLLF